MANIDRANGFRPVKSLVGGDWTTLVRPYTAADRSADTTGNHGDIYIGTPVKLVAGLVLAANSGDTILGVAVGTGTQTSTFGVDGYFNPSDLGKRFLAYDDDGIVGVVPAEMVLFEAQTNDDLDLVAGSLADISVAAATAHGDRVTGNSTAEIVVASNNDVKVVEDKTTPDNDTTLENARHFVKFQTTENTL